MPDQDTDPLLLQAFFTESADLLERLVSDLEQVEGEPENIELINGIFRAMHTIKGNSSFLDLNKITELAHKAETLLDRIRKKQLGFSGPIRAVCLQVAEDLKTFIVEQNLNYNATNTLQELDAILSGQQKPELAKVNTEAHVDVPTVARERIVGNSVRMDERRFDKIISLVSELEVYRNYLELMPEKLELLGEVAEDIRFDLDFTVSKVAHLTRSLSSLVLGAKLVPVNNVFLRFSKVVKDLSIKLDKDIRLEIKNGEAELDKSIVDAVADPMTHLIRNSADHGIENREERVKKGKSAHGTVTLNSYVKGNFVYIEISDDGRGIDPHKIVAKAVEKGIVPKDKVDTMTEAQKLGLIFAPGFSTAETVTDISGRGVGMDVVKSNINRLKGSVLIDSRVGQGTVIKLRFPMSMMVMLSLFVEINGNACAIALDQIEESCDFKRQDFLTELPKRESDKHIGLYSLNQLLWGKNIDVTQTTFHVLRFKGFDNIGFIVDEFLSIEEALVQSVDSYIASLPGVQGATSRKDGTVSLVLNMDVLIAMAQRTKPIAFVRRREKAVVDITKLTASPTRAIV
jgi:two-component system chemotaxis sensor kinase CheA